jgi:hypothetical protein
MELWTVMVWVFEICPKAVVFRLMYGGMKSKFS